MPLREDILKAIPGDNPSGQSLRYAPLYDQIKEARREDDELAQGAWQRDRKLADNGQVIKLAEEAIAAQSKDLQLAAWLTEASLRKNGFGGLQEGLQLCIGLIAGFWDTLYPEIEDGDLEARAAPLEWIGTKFDDTVKKAALSRDRYNFHRYKESRLVGYEGDAQSKEQKTAREKSLKEGKLAPEIFDKSFVETPKSFYLQAEKQLDASLQTLKELNSVCAERFQSGAPSFSKLSDAIVEVRRVAHALLEKKRETEPDPVEAVPETAAPEGEAAAEGAVAEATAGTVSFGSISGLTAAEPEDRREAIASVVAAAAVLRKREPFSPAPYLMLRGLRWGELRAASDPLMLVAPSTEHRQQIRALAVAGRWAELLEAAEHLMAMPCSRAWLDLQRVVVDACVALGEQYNAIAIALRSELRHPGRQRPNAGLAAGIDGRAVQWHARRRHSLRSRSAELLRSRLAKEVYRSPSVGPGGHAYQSAPEGYRDSAKGDRTAT
jgi:type VI secretion system protein ImpA